MLGEVNQTAARSRRRVDMEGLIGTKNTVLLPGPAGLMTCGNDVGHQVVWAEVASLVSRIVAREGPVGVAHMYTVRLPRGPWMELMTLVKIASWRLALPVVAMRLT